MADTAVEAPPRELPKADPNMGNVNGDSALAAKEGSEDKREHHARSDRRNDRGQHRSFQKGRQNDGKFNNKRGGKFGKGNRSKLTVEEESNDPVQIRKQVEFYFSDSNLPSDKFLFSLVGGHENKAVPIQTIHNFKRMRHFQPFSAVVDALRESSTLNVVEVEKQETKEEATDKKDQDDTDSSTKQLCVQRKHPLPEGKSASSQSEVAKVFETAAMARSIYAKGFGVEQPTTQFDLEAFFSTYGPTNAVRLRRAGDKTFKGSVFVEFADEETARTFLEAEPKPTYHGRNLVLKSKKQYCDEKVDEINRGQIRGQSPKASSKEKERDWRERREEDRKKGFPPVNGKDHSGKKSHEKEEGISRKRGHEDLEGGDEENGAVKKVDTEGHASADKDDENIADAPAEVAKTEEEGVSRKRSNEDMDAGDEGERAAKKVDSKEVVSAVEAGTNAVDENPEAEATS